MEGEPGEMRKKPVENGKNYKKMCIWKNYLKDRYPLLLGFVFLAFIFFAVAGLYGYDGSVIKMFYAVILSFFAGSVICFFDYLRYRGKCLKLQEALMKDEESDYCLPSPKGLIEGLYYDIVCQMGREKRELITELDEKRADMMDYYTMWIHQIKIPIAALKLLQQRMEEEERAENQDGESDLEAEAWNYVAVGSGHGPQWWREFFSAARMSGYDGDVALEMEDMTMPMLDGHLASLRTLRDAL